MEPREMSRINDAWSHTSSERMNDEMKEPDERTEKSKSESESSPRDDIQRGWGS